ncbi:MAG: hypothetical protein AAF989_14135, partial [Planctomycetota bacterium]
MSQLAPYLLLDAACVVGLSLAFCRRLSVNHPVFHFILFHLYVITWRGWSLFFGSPPMYYHLGAFEAITADEIARGILFADIFAVCFGLGGLCLQIGSRTWNTRRSVAKRETSVGREKTLIYCVMAMCMPLGIAALILARSGVLPGEIRNVFAMLAFWPISGLLMGCFARGFRWFYLIPTIAYLLMVATQGFHRFMVVLPIIFLICCYCQRSNRRWPSLSMVGGLILLGLIFPQLKIMGRAYQDGDYESLRSLAVQSFAVETHENGFDFLDQLSGALSMTDEHGRVWFGSTYLSAVTLPIPRALWPTKPGLGDHTIAIATQYRPYDR